MPIEGYRAEQLSLDTCAASEPIPDRFDPFLAIIQGGVPLEIQSGTASLQAVCGDSLDRVDLSAIGEGHLKAEGAIGGEGNRFPADRELSGWIGGSIDAELRIRHQPERAPPPGHSPAPRITSAAGPHPCP